MSLNFLDILTRLIRKFTFSEGMITPTYVPTIIRKLLKINQLTKISEYLHTVDISSIGFDFVRAYIAAVIGDLPSDFIEYIDKSIAHFLSQNETQTLKPYDLILSRRKK